MKKITLTVEDDAGRSYTFVTHGPIRSDEFEIRQRTQETFNALPPLTRLEPQKPASWFFSLKAILHADDETGLVFTVTDNGEVPTNAE